MKLSFSFGAKKPSSALSSVTAAAVAASVAAPTSQRQTFVSSLTEEDLEREPASKDDLVIPLIKTNRWKHRLPGDEDSEDEESEKKKEKPKFGLFVLDLNQVQL